MDRANRWYQMNGDTEAEGRRQPGVDPRAAAALKLVAGRVAIDLPRAAPCPSVVASALYGWFSANGRRFSWRSTSDPYRVLIAEILLRKTGAAAVEALLPALFAAYPSARKLATALPGDLVRLLGPIGLGRQRGAQLHALGQRLVSDFGGAVPGKLAELLSLPGVGPYTAVMVAATCSGAPVPAVDTNVARVLCRVFGLAPSHFEARKSPNVWQAARTLLDAWPGPPTALSWALLDLGALICTARKPRCRSCPLQACCAFARPIAASAPCG
jgi:A/G-specific adenine glycosylase